MSSTLFISDLHLADTRPAVTRAFAAFLQAHTDCRQLYILGDLFELWLGDDDDSPLAAEVMALLRDFSAAGPELFIMRGNRDFLLGEDFCAAAGASLLPDTHLIKLGEQTTLLLHGDTLCTADTDYQQFRLATRNRAWQAEFLGHSLDQRRTLAQQLRAMSSAATSNKPEDIMDVSPGAVAVMMRGHGASQLIHGHTHRPARHEESAGSRWVLGDWGAKGWFIEAADGEINLCNIDIKQ